MESDYITISKLHKRDYDVYFCDIPSGMPKREAERHAVGMLVKHAFGENAVLSHRDDGAPYIETTNHHISVSHSRHTACLAVSRDYVTGIDIEEVSDRILRVKDKIINGVIRPKQMSQTDWMRCLTKCWCIKEAVFKSEGETAGYMGENVNVSIEQMQKTTGKISTELFEYKFAQVPVKSVHDEVCMVTLQQELQTVDVTRYIFDKVYNGDKLLAVLLDPEKCSDEDLTRLEELTRNRRPDIILVGGSTMSVSVDSFTKKLRAKNMQVPVILFPGGITQVSDYADAIFFLSLLSGRNAEALIGQQVRAARKVRLSKLQALPLAYILVDGGTQSAVARVTHTEPISQDNVDLIVDTALAGTMLGMNYVYLEAGSGASVPVRKEVISAVSEQLDGNQLLIVGGGITTPQQMLDAYEAGADMVVIGNHFEKHPDMIPVFLKTLDDYNHKQ